MPWIEASSAGACPERSRRGPSAVAKASHPCIVVLEIIVLFLVSCPLLSGATPERRLSIYSVAANYSLPLVQRDGHDYIGLLELLEPLGRVSAEAEGNKWRLRYNNV